MANTLHELLFDPQVTRRCLCLWSLLLSSSTQHSTYYEDLDLHSAPGSYLGSKADTDFFIQLYPLPPVRHAQPCNQGYSQVQALDLRKRYSNFHSTRRPACQGTTRCYYGTQPSGELFSLTTSLSGNSGWSRGTLALQSTNSVLTEGSRSV
jgi:hypothetical protein